MIKINPEGGQVSGLNLALVAVLRVALYATILRLLRPALDSLPGLALGGVLVAFGGVWLEVVFFKLLRWAGVTRPLAEEPEASVGTNGPPVPPPDPCPTCLRQCANLPDNDDESKRRTQ